MVINKNVILVDKYDKKIGEEEVIAAHLNGGKRHRAVSVFLFNEKGQLLLQQRSKKKIVGALQWANTCCGNVRVGETCKSCALRRLREELGIVQVKIKELYSFEYHIQCNEVFSEWEIDHVFVGKYQKEILPNPDEVAAYSWKNIEELLQDLTNNEETYAPWFRIMMKDKRLLGTIGAYAK